MSDTQRTAAKRRFDRECQVTCPACDGSGRVVADAVSARARRGGTASYLRSLEPGQFSMKERGLSGGRPREATLTDLIATSGHTGSVELQEVGT